MRPCSTSIPSTSVFANTLSAPFACARSRMIVPKRSESTMPTDRRVEAADDHRLVDERHELLHLRRRDDRHVVDPPRLRRRHAALQLLHPLLGARHLDAAALGEDAGSSYWRTESSVSCVISFEWSTGKMKFDACPVEPPGFGSGPLSSRTRSRPAELGEVIGEAVADDAGADHDGARGGRQRGCLSHSADISRSREQHARIAVLEVLDVGAHELRRAVRLARAHRLEQRPVLEHGGPQLAGSGRARASRCAARARSTRRASPRGSWLCVRGRSCGGSAGRASISARVVAPLPGRELVQQLAELVQVRLRRALGREPRGLGLEHGPHLAQPREIAHVDAR